MKNLRPNLGSKVLSTENQIEKLNSVILATDVADSPLPWGFESGTDFTDMYANYEELNTTYNEGKQLAKKQTEHKNTYQSEIRKCLQEISQYIKVNNDTFYEELRLYGFEVINSTNGIIKIPNEGALIENLCQCVLDKHNADGSSSFIKRFDMVGLQTNLDSMQSASSIAKQATLDWRHVAIEKSDTLQDLTTMRKLIGREMLRNPNVETRDMETWGFVGTEYIKPRDTEAAA